MLVVQVVQMVQVGCCSCYQAFLSHTAAMELTIVTRADLLFENYLSVLLVETLGP